MSGIEVLNLNLGRVECSVCGPGNNRFIVTLFSDNSFTVTRHSRCYGDEVQEFVDRYFLAEYIKRNDFLVATRYARHELKHFMKRLMSGHFTWARYGHDSDSFEEDEPIELWTLNMGDSFAALGDATNVALNAMQNFQVAWSPIVEEESPF